MTPEEKKLWYDFLKLLPTGVKRQFTIGNYIVDFYIPSRKLVIELDGVQHNMRDKKAEDIERDEFLSRQGINVLRIPNESIRTRFTEVSGVILESLNLTFDNLKNKITEEKNQ